MKILRPVLITQFDKNVKKKKREGEGIDWRTAKEIAHYFKVSRQLIHTWSYRKNDPIPFRKISTVLQYDFAKVKEWKERNVVKNY